MFKNYSFSIIIIGFFILIGCSRTEDTPTPTQLQITVRDKNNDLVSGASVFLYGTETDWANATNLLYSDYTDSKGIALIDLEDRKYYIAVTYNCLSNKIAATSDYTLVVSKNTLNKKDIQVIGTGILTLRNYSQYSVRFDLSQNNVALPYYIVPPYTTNSYYLQDGYYDVTAKYLPNGITYTLGKNYMNCGGNLVFNNP